MLRVEHRGGVANELAQHRGLGVQLHQRELDALIDRQRFSPRGAAVRVRHGLVDAVLGCAERGCRLADAVLVDEVLGELQPTIRLTEQRIGTHADIGEAHLGVVGRHVERPPEEVDVEARRIGRHQERTDALRASRLARGAGEDDVVGRVVESGVPPLHSVDHPLVAIADRSGLHVGGVAAMVRLGEPEGEPASPVEEARHPIDLLLFGAEVTHHEHRGEVPDDRRLVLEIVVQSEPLVGQVLADDGHLQVAGVRATELRRQRQPEPTGGVGSAAHLAQQLLPVLPRHAVVVEVGPSPLATMVEESDVVVLLLQRRDLGVDERIELVERVLDVGGNLEVHRPSVATPPLR